MSNENRNNKSSTKTLIALATYNEIENLPSLVEKLRQTVPQSDILILDDNSPDGTGKWALNASSFDSHIKVIIRTDERGLGSAVIKALSFAVENDYDFVVNMDADFSHPISDVPRLLERIMDTSAPVDVVIGSRYVSGGGVKNWPLKRRVMSRCINMYARFTLGLKTHDNSGSFRCYRVSTLKQLHFNDFVSRGYSFFEETLYRLKIVSATFTEIPITFIDREKGISKINRKEAYKAIWIMFKIGLSRPFRRNL